MPPSTSVVISQLEPAVFLRGQSAAGEDARGRRRPVNMAAQPSQLRALLTLHVSKPIRVREISITLEGTSHTEWPEGIGPNRLELFEDSEIFKQTTTLFSSRRDQPNVAAGACVPSRSATTTPINTPPTTPGSPSVYGRGRASSLDGSRAPFQFVRPPPPQSGSSTRGGRSSSGPRGPTPPDRVLAERENKSDIRSAISTVASRAGAALRPPSPSTSSIDAGRASPLLSRGRDGAPRGASPTDTDLSLAAAAYVAAERERVLSPLEKGLKKLNLTRSRGRSGSRDGSPSTPSIRTPARTPSKGPDGGPPPAPSAARAAAPIPISRVPESESEDHQVGDYFTHNPMHSSLPGSAVVTPSAHNAMYSSLPGSAVTTPFREDPPSYTYDPPEGSPETAHSGSDDALFMSEPTSAGSAPSTFTDSGGIAASTQASPPLTVSTSPETRTPGRPMDPAPESVWAAGPQGKGILHHTPRGRGRDLSAPPAGAVRFDPTAVRTPGRDTSASSASSAGAAPSSSPPRPLPADRHRPKLAGMGMLSRALAEGQSKDTEDSREFKPGTYTFPICIPLPSNLPPTLHADFGGNTYMLKALVHRPGPLTPNLTAEKEVTFVSAPEDEELETLDPIVVQRIWEDALSYVVIVSGKSFPIGGAKIPIWLKFVPLTKISVHRLSVGLEEKTDYYAKGRRVARHENPRRWQLVYLANEDGTPLLPVPDNAQASDLQSALLAPLVVAGADPGDVTGPDPEDALARMADPHGPWEMVLDVDIPKNLHKINLSSTHTKSNIAVHHMLRIVIRIERGAEAGTSSTSTKGRLFDIVIEAPISLNHSYTNDDWIKLPNYDHAEGTRSLSTDGVGEGVFQHEASASGTPLQTREEDRGRSRNAVGMLPRLLSSSASRDRSVARGPSSDRTNPRPSSGPFSTHHPHISFPLRTPRSSQDGGRPSQSSLGSGSTSTSASANVHANTNAGANPEAQTAESRILSRRWLALSQASARFGNRLELPGEQREGDDGLPEPSGPPPPPYQTAVFSLPVGADAGGEGQS